MSLAELLTGDGMPTLAKALSSGVVVWALVRSLDGAPAAVTASVISLPMVLGAGYVAMAGRQSDAFLVEAASRGAQSMLGVIVFVSLAARGFGRLGLPSLLALCSICWAVTVLAATSTAEPWSIGTSVLAGLAAIAVTHFVWPIRPAFAGRSAVSGPRRVAWPVAVQAAAMVLALSVFAGMIGTRFSAILAAFPVAMAFVTIGMKHAGSMNVAATYQSARLGLPCLYAYLAGIVVLTPPLGGPAATLVAFVPSIALSALIVGARMRFALKESAP